jgi:hypothetical protein
MKLKHFTRQDSYLFKLVFENGGVKETDLKELIGKYVALEALNTADLDTNWGCLEFKGGMVDIEPKTLYEYANRHEASTSRA